MTERGNKSIVRRYFEEVWNKGNIDAADDLFAPCFSMAGGALSGVDAVKLYVSSYRALYPRVNFTLLSLVAEGDKVAACWAARGMHPVCLEETTGAKPSSTTTTGFSIYRISGGKIVEAWAASDHLGAMRSLGITGTYTSEADGA